jgi:predicted AAA+ superfamily ATPase
MGEAGRTYLTLDDQTVLEAAQSDPAGFIRGLDRAIIDEIQRAPDLLLAIKKTVDEDYRPGRFLLTGSANVLTLPRIADSLAGRMETIRMLPLARAEIEGRTPSFLEHLFDGSLKSPWSSIIGDDFVQLVLLGGFPEAISRNSERRRQDWARSYLTSILTRDLRDIADVEKLTELPKFVRLLAEHTSQLVNYSQFGGSINVTHKTGQRYVGLLEQVFLVATVQPWFTNTLKRIVKTPKLHFLDSGLLASARAHLRPSEGGSRNIRRAAGELRVFRSSEANDGVGPAVDTISFPGSGHARGRHRTGTRRRDDRWHRG